MIKRGSFMKNFYDLQQFLKTFGIISKEEFLRAMLIIKQEVNYELSKG